MSTLIPPKETASDKEVKAFLRRIAGVFNGGLFLVSDTVTSTSDWTPEIGDLGQLISYQSVVISEGGIGNGEITVNATDEPSQTMLLVLDFTTDYGDVGTANMASQYVVASSPAPDSENHVLVTFIWKSSTSKWQEICRQTTA